MEIKKSPKADLENKRSLYVLIGLVMVLAFMYIAFEWTQTEVKKIEIVEEFLSEGEEEVIPVTVQENTPPPPPPPPAAVVVEVLNIVDNQTEVAQTEIKSTEDDKSEKIEIAPVVAPVVEEEIEDEIFTIVEKKPSFPGGEKAMMEYISKSIKYPVIAMENGIKGRVIVSFVVNKDGKIVDVQVVRGVDPSLDKEAIRVVQSMPAWSPGEQRGKPVRTRFTLPIMFRLQ